jgi:hypothetical protein
MAGLKLNRSRQRTLVILLIGLGLLIVGVFGLRTLHALREFRGHRPSPPFAVEQAQDAETDVELIRDWMTIPFVARMYQVPPPVLFESLQIPKNRSNEKKSIQQLNEEYFPEQPNHVITLVKATIQSSIAVPTAIPADTKVPPATAVP